MYLLTQIWWLLAIAFLLGVLLGYIVWRACGIPRLSALALRDRLENEERLRALQRENARFEEIAAEAQRTVRRFEADKAAASETALTKRQTPVPASSNGASGAQLLKPPVPMPANGHATSADVSRLSVNSGPASKADNLRLIRGIGPRLEKILNSMGVFRFDQIAHWTEADLAVIDDYLGDFAGRAVRDRWIDQSRKLAGLDEPPKVQ